MLLLETKSPETTLEIVPKKHSNIARFINSIGPKSKSKQNIKTLWAEVDKKMVVLLYATRIIKAGEELYYDYNEGKGSTSEYDTSSY